MRLAHAADRGWGSAAVGQPDAHRLEKAGRGALERRLDLGAEVGLAQVAAGIEHLRLVADLEHQVQIVRVGRKERDGKGLEP